MSGKQPESTGNIAIDCMLSLEDANFPPDQKISPSSMLLAVTLAQQKQYDDGEERPVTEIFIAELKQILERDEQVSLEKILLTVEQQIEEVTGDGNGYTEEGMKRVATLSYTATMLRTAIRQESQKE